MGPTLEALLSVREQVVIPKVEHQGGRPVKEEAEGVIPKVQ